MKGYIAANPCGWKTNDSLAQAGNRFVSDVLNAKGYPGYSLVGEEASEKFFYLMSLPFVKKPVQRQGLQLMKPKVDDKDVKGEVFARMYDRMSLDETGKQLYGTVVNLGCADCKADEKKFTVMPLAEPDRVDELRRTVGLSPMKEYLEKLKMVFTNVSAKNVVVQNPCNEKAKNP